MDRVWAGKVLSPTGPENLTQFEVFEPILRDPPQILWERSGNT